MPQIDSPTTIGTATQRVEWSPSPPPAQQRIVGGQVVGLRRTPGAIDAAGEAAVAGDAASDELLTPGPKAAM